MDEEDEFQRARRERIESYCADETFNTGCNLEDDDDDGDKELLIRGRAMPYVGVCAVLFLAIGAALN